MPVKYRPRCTFNNPERAPVVLLRGLPNNYMKQQRWPANALVASARDENPNQSQHHLATPLYHKVLPSLNMRARLLRSSPRINGSLFRGINPQNTSPSQHRALPEARYCPHCCPRRRGSPLPQVPRGERGPVLKEHVLAAPHGHGGRVSEEIIGTTCAGCELGESGKDEADRSPAHGVADRRRRNIKRRCRRKATTA